MLQVKHTGGGTHYCNFLYDETGPAPLNRCVSIENGLATEISSFAFDAKGNKTQRGTDDYFEFDAAGQLKY